MVKPVQVSIAKYVDEGRCDGVEPCVALLAQEHGQQHVRKELRLDGEPEDALHVRDDLAPRRAQRVVGEGVVLRLIRGIEYESTGEFAQRDRIQTVNVSGHVGLTPERSTICGYR